MTAQTRDTLKALFETGDTLEQASFVDLIDSFVCKVEGTAETVDGPLTLTIASMTYSNVTTTVLSTAQTSAIFSQLGQGDHKVMGLMNITIDGSTYGMPFFHKGTF